MSATLLAGVELGGTKCICILGTGPDDIRARVTVPTLDPDTTLDSIAAVIQKWREQARPTGCPRRGLFRADRFAS